jgi:OOP family OmpA-OmpF porin
MNNKNTMDRPRLDAPLFQAWRSVVFWTIFGMCMSGPWKGVHAQANEGPELPSSKSASAPILKFGDKFQMAQTAPEQQTRIFIYRQAITEHPNPVNIYLESRFHTALLGGGYSEFCAAPGSIAIQTGYDDAKKRHLTKETPGQFWTLTAGQSLYLRVNEDNPANMRLVEVAPDTAQKQLPHTAIQTHVVSRAPAAQLCAPVQTAAPVLSLATTPGLTAKVPAPAEAPGLAAAVPSPAVAHKPGPSRAYALQSDALFEFGKTELKASGYNTIEIMAQQLIRDFQHVERIRVVGHSDSIGKPKTNRALSLARAQVVARQLQERGVKTLKGFQMEGQGADSLLKTHCPNRPTPANKLCHAPNRRVEIIVYGARI